jgi:uncharacterized protein (DUF849 family)
MTVRRNVIITCAPTGLAHTPSMSPYLPITADQIVADAVGAAEAGASIIHLHARDPQTGRPDPDPDLFLSILSRIKERTDAVLLCNTAGRLGSDIDQRIEVALRARPEMCSFNAGSMNFGLFKILDNGRPGNWKQDWESAHFEATLGRPFINSFADIEYILRRVGEGCDTRFEFEVHDVGQLYNLAYFLDRGLIRTPLFLEMILGVLGGIGADVENLVHLCRIADKLFGRDYLWSVVGLGPDQIRFANIAAAIGGHARLGLEDSLWIGDGELAKSSAEQIWKFRRILTELNLGVATPAETRAMLGLKGADKVAF